MGRQLGTGRKNHDKEASEDEQVFGCREDGEGAYDRVRELLDSVSGRVLPVAESREAARARGAEMKPMKIICSGHCSVCGQEANYGIEFNTDGVMHHVLLDHTHDNCIAGVVK